MLQTIRCFAFPSDNVPGRKKFFTSNISTRSHSGRFSVATVTSVAMGAQFEERLTSELERKCFFSPKWQKNEISQERRIRMLKFLLVQKCFNQESETDQACTQKDFMSDLQF